MRGALASIGPLEARRRPFLAPMARFPAEVWDMVFHLACRDGGQAGRALSQVSRHIRQISARFRYFSLTIYSAKQVGAIMSMVSRVPPNSVCIQHLFVYLPEEGFTETDGKALSDAFRRFYGGPASKVKTLFASVDDGFDWSWVKDTIPLHYLVDLEQVALVHTGRDHYLSLDGLWSSEAQTPDFPSMRRLHIALAQQPNFSALSIAMCTPRLSDAQWMGVLPAAYFTDISARTAFIAVVLRCFADLPSSVRRYTFGVQIQDPSPETLGAFDSCAQTLREEAQRIKPGAELSFCRVAHMYTDADVYSDWLDILTGGDGCWGHDPPHSISASGGRGE